MGCTLWVRVRFQINDEPELMSLFMHSDAYGQYGETSNDLPRLEAFKDGCIEYNPNSFSNYNGGGAVADDDVVANEDIVANDGAADANNNEDTTEGSPMDTSSVNTNNHITDIGTGASVVNDNQIINNNISDINQNNDNINLHNGFFYLNNTPNDTIRIGSTNTSIDNYIINEIVEDNNLINGNIFEPFEELNDEVVMCPLCRTESHVGTQIHDIRGSSDMCSVCMDRNVEVFLGGCGHACMCRECYQQIRDTEIEENI